MENAGQRLRYLTIAEILRIAERHVGDYRLLNENQLYYLVEVVGGKYGDTELYPTLHQKAAVYAHHIITGHIFFDGNKRIGMTCALLFLNLNDCFFDPDIDDAIIDLGLKIADRSVTDIEVIADHIQSWIL